MTETRERAHGGLFDQRQDILHCLMLQLLQKCADLWYSLELLEQVLFPDELHESLFRLLEGGVYQLENGVSLVFGEVIEILRRNEE
jgi:hypothetical protein